MAEEPKSQHEEFLRGFGAALRLTEPAQIQKAYQRWLGHEWLSLDERIDLESGGYEAGYECGTDFK